MVHVGSYNQTYHTSPSCYYILDLLCVKHYEQIKEWKDEIAGPPSRITNIREMFPDIIFPGWDAKKHKWLDWISVFD